MKRVIGAVFLLFGTFLLTFPFVSGFFRGLSDEQEQGQYEAQAAPDPDAVRWNEELSFLSELSEEEKETYQALLDPLGTGMMGTVEIPKLDVSLPIYHGVEDITLASAVGHLPGSSLPTGGAGNHVILAAHSGLATADYFSRIGTLTEGDRFQIRAMGETMVYEVIQIQEVYPEELDVLKQTDDDLVTLVTCTPPGANTKRLLVTGRRCMGTVGVKSIRTDLSFVAALVAWMAVFRLVFRIFSERSERNA